MPQYEIHSNLNPSVLTAPQVMAALHLLDPLARADWTAPGKLRVASILPLPQIMELLSRRATELMNAVPPLLQSRMALVTPECTCVNCKTLRALMPLVPPGHPRNN